MGRFGRIDGFTLNVYFTIITITIIIIIIDITITITKITISG